MLGYWDLRLKLTAWRLKPETGEVNDSKCVLYVLTQFVLKLFTLAHSQAFAAGENPASFNLIEFCFQVTSRSGYNSKHEPPVQIEYTSNQCLGIFLFPTADSYEVWLSSWTHLKLLMAFSVLLPCQRGTPKRHRKCEEKTIYWSTRQTHTVTCSKERTFRGKTGLKSLYRQCRDLREGFLDASHR
ncbi:hypothetical protein STEG23_012526 [Scotinomys teguina]